MVLSNRIEARADTTLKGNLRVVQHSDDNLWCRSIYAHGIVAR
jgi:hypothetical protein